MKSIFKNVSLLLAVLVNVRSSTVHHDESNMRPQSSDGCLLPETAIDCVSEDGVMTDILDADTVVKWVICLCWADNSNTTVERICIQTGHGFVWKDTSEVNEGRFVGSRKQERSLEKRSFHISHIFHNASHAISHVSHAISHVSHTFHNAFDYVMSPINSVIGTGIGFAQGVVCTLLCPPQQAVQQKPHYPPSLKCAQIDGPATIVAKQGEISAPVNWTEPEATEQGGRKISVKVNPSSFKSGNQFPEGRYVVSFWATDAYGLSVECAISFTVKAECPAGSYADGYTVHLCPRGQYQDQTGQSTCKPCPQGKTTQGTGSVDISECAGNNVHSGEKGHVDDSSDATEGVKIAIGVCVSIGILILAGAAIVFVYKYINNRRHRVNDSTHGLQGPYPMTYVAPSNTHFQKQPL